MIAKLKALFWFGLLLSFVADVPSEAQLPAALLCCCMFYALVRRYERCPL